MKQQFPGYGVAASHAEMGRAKVGRLLRLLGSGTQATATAAKKGWNVGSWLLADLQRTVIYVCFTRERRRWYRMAKPDQADCHEP